MLTLASHLMVDFVVSNIRRFPISGVKAFRSLPPPDIANARLLSAHHMLRTITLTYMKVVGRTNA